ncbi:hypothetical protein Bccel_5388 [Pseudobacteroides cellulosolvens ATCC 35603 = DSM 2933]|uniref:Uncharacterized protein n=1 Tax=Pseudobacteroides cellulosolvens ATCC 35603 = DSM 2933 TaxID=398512 RepID=A0A0L6JW72_9FIRM|nr:hypothetical protein Bccel_5388 [Pseudobacteroides cellulosolvens ATCC 35603 = DSM 2933]
MISYSLYQFYHLIIYNTIMEFCVTVWTELLYFWKPVENIRGPEGLGYVHEISPDTHTFFPSYTHFINTRHISVQLLDFGLSRNLVHVTSLRCNKPEFCLILSSDSSSRWTPLASAVSFPLSGGLGTFTR